MQLIRAGGLKVLIKHISKNSKLKTMQSVDFKLEKNLQALIEENLEEVFNIRFIASEFSTGNVHSGRIDALGIS